MIVRGMNSRTRFFSTTRSRRSRAAKAIRLELTAERVVKRAPVEAVLVAAISREAPSRSA
jgi:hypothetical protein